MRRNEKRPRPGQGIEGAKSEAAEATMPAPCPAVNEFGNSTEAQRSRILAALRKSALTTLEARRFLDVLHPAARIMELRKRGFEIVTIWTWDLTSEGNQHRVARYILREEGRHATA